MGAEATVEAPPRRRTSWSLKTIVEDVAGRPVEELQDPERPLHPFWKGKVDAPRPAARPVGDGEPYDPVGHLYPPLVGPTGREFHGAAHEHHTETLARHNALGTGPAGTVVLPGPSHRPERLYLHYLLLHMDRLSDSALRYLRRAVEEEIAHRERPPEAPPHASASSGEA